MKRLATLLAMAILILPPVPVQGKSVMVGVCGGSDVRIAILVDSMPPSGTDDRRCCKKGCHAASDRRKKSGDIADESCCWT